MRIMKIGNVDITKKTFILAEIGNNHNGDFEIAKHLVHEAANAGADGVKFQTFKADRLVHKDLPVAAQVRGAHKTQYERMKSVELKESHHFELKRLADQLDLVFLSTPFDEDSVDFLDELVPAFKIASGDLTNLPLINRAVSKGKPIILSTGMGSEDEIDRALEVIPKGQVILLHCVARYPTPIEEANLLSIPYLRNKYNIPVGYSDHTIGIDACKIAISLGAVFVEKHFTFDKNQPLGDHKLSMEPDELAQLVYYAPRVKRALGSYGKPVGQQEGKNRKIMRRSLYAKTDISEGAIISKDMLTSLRPASGLSPAIIDEIVGKRAAKFIRKGFLIKKEDIMQY